MADLLSSLILPKNSQESFHSTTSQPQSNVAPEIPSKALILTPPSSAQEQASAFQATDLPVYNIDAYLTDPQNADLLKTSAKGNQSQPKMSQRANDSLEPIPLGSRTSHYVSTFMNLCQSKGLVPFFDIDGDVSNAEFRGALRIGDVTIVSEKRWHSKKEAREALAAKGLETVQKMETKHKEPGIPGEPEKNWVGMLQGTSDAGEVELSACRRAHSKILNLQWGLISSHYRILQFDQPESWPCLQLLRSRQILLLRMYHPFSPRPALRFEDRCVPFEEGCTHQWS